MAKTWTQHNSRPAVSSKKALKAKLATNVASLTVEETSPKLRIPWPLVSVIAALSVAVLTWTMLAACSIIAWISYDEIPISAPLKLASQIWLLAHGISVQIMGTTINLMPLGMTLIIIGISHLAISTVAPRTRQLLTVDTQISRRALTFKTASIFTLTYLVILLTVKYFVENQNRLTGFGWALIQTLAVAIWAFAGALGWKPSFGTYWVKAAWRAILVGLSTMSAIGAILVVVAVLVGRSQISIIFHSLAPDNAGAIILGLLQGLWVPNLVLWAAAWASGAGIQIGLDSVISPVRTDLGLVPAIPVFGAIPNSGPLPQAFLCVVASGLIAGALAGYVVLKALNRRHQLRKLTALSPQSAAIVTIVVAALSSLVFCGLCYLSCGDLGAVRLLDVGPRFPQLLAFSTTSMSLGAFGISQFITFKAHRHSNKTTDNPANDETQGLA